MVAGQCQRAIIIGLVLGLVLLGSVRIVRNEAAFHSASDFALALVLYYGLPLLGALIILGLWAIWQPGDGSTDKK